MIIQLTGLLLFFGLAHCSRSQPEVRLEQGLVRGIYDVTLGKRQIATYLGIPYANPVVGQNKFKESEASGPWLGVLNATRVPPSCLQLDHYLYITPSGMHGVEDCLFINVYTPKLMEPEEGEKLFDVIVFIHGGAFMMMTSTFFQPSLLLDKDTVFVTFNYRLGSLGFMSTEDDVLPGNNGLKDQLLALKWVKKNIHAFGGNPHSVTLAGLSAGSAAVHYHILSPKSKGLFHKAIMMSGSTLNPWTQVEKANEKTRYIADMLGCPTKDSASMIKCLSERPAQHILATSRDLQRWLHHPFSPIAPIIEHKHDGAFISRKPLDIIKSQSYNDVPLLISFVDGEGIYPSSEIVQKDNLEVMKKDWDRLIPCVLEYNYTVPESRKTTIGHNIIGEYKLNLDEPQGIQNFMRMLGDRLFVSGIFKTVKYHASLNKSPVFFYKFSYMGKHSGSHFLLREHPGVLQGDDLLYILYSKNVSSQDTDNDRAVSKKMVEVWATFASRGALCAPWATVTKAYPKIPFINITGPDNFNREYAEDLGKESFWDSLFLQEN